MSNLISKIKKKTSLNPFLYGLRILIFITKRHQLVQRWIKNLPRNWRGCQKTQQKDLSKNIYITTSVRLDITLRFNSAPYQTSRSNLIENFKRKTGSLGKIKQDNTSMGTGILRNRMQRKSGCNNEGLSTSYCGPEPALGVTNPDHQEL